MPCLPRRVVIVRPDPVFGWSFKRILPGWILKISLSLTCCDHGQPCKEAGQAAKYECHEFIPEKPAADSLFSCIAFCSGDAGGSMRSSLRLTGDHGLPENGKQVVNIGNWPECFPATVWKRLSLRFVPAVAVKRNRTNAGGPSNVRTESHTWAKPLKDFSNCA